MSGRGGGRFFDFSGLVRFYNFKRSFVKGRILVYILFVIRNLKS